MVCCRLISRAAVDLGQGEGCARVVGLLFQVENVLCRNRQAKIGTAFHWKGLDGHADQFTLFVDQGSASVSGGGNLVQNPRGTVFTVTDIPQLLLFGLAQFSVRFTTLHRAFDRGPGVRLRGRQALDQVLSRHDSIPLGNRQVTKFGHKSSVNLQDD